MRRLTVILFAFQVGYAQYTVTTVAGGAPATSGSGGGIAHDVAGNTYLCGGTIVSRLAPDGTMTTVAGTGVAGYSGDGGPAVAAQLNGAYDCAVDSGGSLVVADSQNYRIRRIDSFGTITTIIGTGVPGELGEGDAGTAAQIGYVTGLAIDAAGNIYFSDGPYIRRLSASGMVQRIAGNGSGTSSGDGGPALSATLAMAGYVTVDGAGNVYCNDNGLIRKISGDGTISTVAGSTTASGPLQDGMLATSGYLRSVTALASDVAGDLFIGAGGMIRRADAKTGIVTTAAGSTNQSGPSQGPALNVFFGSVFALSVDNSGLVWISSSQLATLNNGVVTTVISNPGYIEPPDGAEATAVSLSPTSIAVSRAGDLYIGEATTCTIRKVGADGKLATVPGTGNCSTPATVQPTSIAVDSQGNVYSSNASQVYSISPSGSVSLVNGLPGGNLAIDSQDRVYSSSVIGLKIVRIAPGGTAQTLLTPQTPGNPSGLGAAGKAEIALDSNDNLFVAASSFYIVGPTSIYRMDSATGQVTAVPGSFPDNVTSIAVDHRGDFWLADSGENLTATGAGLSYEEFPAPFLADGPLLAAGLGGLRDLQTGPDGSIYAIDGSYRVRKISGAPPSVSPEISTAGMVNAASLASGPISPGELISIFGVNLGASSLQSFTLTNNSVPAVLDDIEVLINNAPAPITAVSPNQVNVFAPYTIAGQSSATITVNAHGAPSATLQVPIAASAFGLFTADGSGSGPGAILNQDGSYNSASNPAPAGSVVSLFGTGEGGITPSTPAGGLVISTPFPSFSQPVHVTVGGQSAQVLYDGAAPFLPAGVDQINLAIPAGTPSGPAAIAVTVGSSATSKIVTVAVK